MFKEAQNSHDLQFLPSSQSATHQTFSLSKLTLYCLIFNDFYWLNSDPGYVRS